MSSRLSAVVAAVIATTILAGLTGCAKDPVTATAGSSTVTTAPAGSVGSGVGGQAGNVPTNSTTAAPRTAPPAAPTSASTTYTPAPTTPLLLPEASECTPGSTTTLPDGLYFGYVTDALDDAIQFDLACWFTGESAAKAATADGAESPPPDDYYIRNTNKIVRSVSVGSRVDVTWLPNIGNPATAQVTYQQWVLARSPSFPPPVWITVKAGALTGIVEQYLP